MNKFLTSLVFLLITAVGVSCTTTEQRGTQGGGNATLSKVVLKAPTLRSKQVCPAIVRFQGIVTTSTAGMIRYRFISESGHATPQFKMPMQAKESREITHVVHVGEPGGKTLRGTVMLEVTGANGFRTAKTEYRIDCVSNPAEAGETAGLSTSMLQKMVGGEGKEHENLLQEFTHNYLDLRGYSLKNPFSNQRVESYKRLQRMRKLLRRPHRSAGWMNRPPAGPGAPGVVDANQCAWSSLGPTNINGRVTDIAIDPTNHQRLFITTVGGIWRSNDDAQTWQRVSDDFLATVFASVAINPANPAEVFAGGGDPNYHGGWRGGLGIWRSTSGGDPGTWTKVSPAALDGQVIYRLLVDPSAPHDVYAATSTGVYLGTRTGANITFARLGGFDAWTSDMAVDFSATPHLVYAGVRSASATYGRGIWKYDGANWNQRTTGIPTANSRTISLALAKSNPSILYAKVEATDGQLQGIYKTTTGAETPAGGGDAWTNLAAASVLNDSCAPGFCYSWYNSVIAIDPNDADTVWSGGLGIYRTTDGGGSWHNVSAGADASYPLGVHSDHHAVAFDPTNSKIVYVGDDGGLFRTTNSSLASWHWSKVSRGVVITEYYHATSQQALAGIAAGGTQDNGTVITFGNRTWYQPGGCDGSDVAIDASDASTLYGNCNGHLYELTNPVPGTVGGGSQATWTLPASVHITSPLVTDSGTPGAALAAGTDNTNVRLLKTTDGLNWNNATPNLAAGVGITAIGIAPSSGFQTYYLGVNNGEIWRTTTGGGTGAGAWTQASNGLPAGVRTNSIYVDAGNAARAVAATNQGIYLTGDTGANWDSIAGTGATALPTNAITGAVFDPSNPNVVYAVTDVGAFKGTITPAAGASPPTAAWTPFDEGIPDGLDINDIWVNRTNHHLKIGTMGHGVYVRDITPGIVCPAAKLVVRDNVDDRGETPSPSGVPDPEHPIPDPARPGFYMPDNTPAGSLYWWSSEDIRIDVPSTAPVKNQIASADHVEMETCPIELSNCPPETIRDAQPERGQLARVYVDVNNMGLQPATNVRVIALYADASTGLPLLPADFWSTTFPAGTTTCGPLTAGSGWRLADPANPCRVIPVVNPELPEAVHFDWHVPSTQASHSCMFVIVESATDPLDPTVRGSNERKLWVLVPHNREITLRNLHVIDAPPAPTGGVPMKIETMYVPNPSRENKYVDLLVSRVDLPAKAVLGFMVPTRKGVELKGAELSKLSDAEMSRLSLVNNRQSMVGENVTAAMKAVPRAFFRVKNPRNARLRLPIPPGQTWKLNLIVDVGKMTKGESLRFSVIAKQGKTVLGGNTYIIRSPATRK